MTAAAQVAGLAGSGLAKPGLHAMGLRMNAAVTMPSMVYQKPEQYCCDAMERQFEIDSDDQRLIFYAPAIGEYGIVDRKDPDAYAPIGFCPWCGKDIQSDRFKYKPQI